ncbi:MAG TPA: glycoside hydrolase family 15 protein [Actinomycetota bacterium]|nr:glycoside hydrolase family 15 protein [Actinomycetota bacterium]
MASVPSLTVSEGNRDPLPAIEDYALLGDSRTAALTSSTGSIDWLCAPRFDSPPVFGRLVGGPAAGSFDIRPVGLRSTERRYLDGTAVLETLWTTATGALRLTEGLILDVSRSLLPELLLVRRVEGSGAVEVRFDPKRDFGEPPRRSHRDGRATICDWGGLAVSLNGSAGPLTPGRTERIDVSPSAPLTLTVAVHDREPAGLVSPERAWEALTATRRWWEGWSGEIRYDGPLAPFVVRSLITLRLLTYAPSGAPVAAPTTSLPEILGGDRNWDYRYAWPRDAALSVHAFLAVDRSEEAVAFLDWLVNATQLGRPRVRALYTLDGRTRVPERARSDLPGYEGSRPVRVGNAASRQHQLDSYGWVASAMWKLVEAGTTLNPHVWHRLAALTDTTARTWARPDAGMWEARRPERHHVHSKLMAWLALDRMIRSGRDGRRWRRRVARWASARDELARRIHRDGFDQDRGAYVMAFDSTDLDAALLLLPGLQFEPEDSTRVTGTIEAIRRELDAGGGLLYRYRRESDGLQGGEGAFLACSFWLAEALCATGRRDEGGELFERTCRRANGVGLLSEEIDAASGRFLGNFPQALSHSALVQAALGVAASEGSGTSRERRRTKRGRAA